jgi:hypothetical protein
MVARDLPLGESYRAEEPLCSKWYSDLTGKRGERRSRMIEMKAISFLFATTFTSEFYPADIGQRLQREADNSYRYCWATQCGQFLLPFPLHGFMALCISTRAKFKINWCTRWHRLLQLLCYLFILTANGFSPGGSVTTIRHNTHHRK